jgi:hypothetical protein
MQGCELSAKVEHCSSSVVVDSQYGNGKGSCVSCLKVLHMKGDKFIEQNCFIPRENFGSLATSAADASA